MISAEESKDSTWDTSASMLNQELDDKNDICPKKIDSQFYQDTKIPCFSALFLFMSQD